MSQNRILSLRLQRDVSMPERYIRYKETKIDLTSQQYDDLISKLPEYWNTDKDRLTYFALLEDMTYLCQRNKEVYNYSLKETERKQYNFFSAEEENVKQLSSILIAYINEVKLKEIENVYDTLLSDMSDLSYIKSSLLSMRSERLADSDWMFNSDYTFKTPELETEWKAYRQAWRDITLQTAWTEKRYNEIEIPVSPAPRDDFITAVEQLRAIVDTVNIPDDIQQEVLGVVSGAGYAGILKKYTSLIYQIETLKIVARLKLPIGIDFDKLTALDTLLPDDLSKTMRTISANDFDDELTANDYAALITDYPNIVAEKMDAINAVLADANLDFTIGDLLNKFAEATKSAVEQQEVEDLLQDLTLSEE